MFLILVDEDNPGCLERPLDAGHCLNIPRQLYSSSLYPFDRAKSYGGATC